MKLRIYPPIGIARVGNAEEFYIGPERPGSKGVEIDAAGNETEVTEFKSGVARTKRQATRFQLFEEDEASGELSSLALPAGATVTWTVSVANKKDAVVRDNAPPAPPSVTNSVRPVLDPQRSRRIIKAEETVSGDNAQAVKMRGTYLDEAVMLGELVTDANQKLIFIPGRGVANSPEGAPIGGEQGGGQYYNNRDWYDDVCDGWIQAEVKFPERDEPVTSNKSWVVSAPPDFGQATTSPVTLFDVITEVARTNGWISLPERPSFERDIEPILKRTWSLQFSNQSANWRGIDPVLGDASNDPVVANRRARNVSLVRGAEGTLSHNDAFYSKFELQQWQLRYLTAYAEGNFDTGTPPAGAPHEILTRVALDNSVGSTMFPGIEAGMIIRDSSIYLQPFDYRIDPDSVEPGDLSALMALPWQADFLKCGLNWWPTQRPNTVPVEGGQLAWLRPSSITHRQLVTDVMRLGVVSEEDGEVLERQRDPNL